MRPNDQDLHQDVYYFTDWFLFFIVLLLYDPAFLNTISIQFHR